MGKTHDLTWSQVIMAANTPVLLRAAMLEGRSDIGVMASGQVVGLIDDLPQDLYLVRQILGDAEESLARLSPAASAES